MGLTKRLLSVLMPFVFLLAACSSAPSSSSAAQAGAPAPAQSNSANQAGTSMPIPVTGASNTATLSEITGRVLAREAQDSSFSQSTPGYILKALGQVQTQIDGKVRLDFPTGTLLRLGPSTLFTMQPSQVSSQGLIVQVQLLVGRLWIILRGGSLQVQTKSGVAAVLGSLMSVDYNSDSGATTITCLEGHCSLSDQVGTVEITTGQTANITDPNQPAQVGHMTDQDYQDWQNNNPEASAFVPPSSSVNAVVQLPAPPRQTGTTVINPGPQNIPVTGAGPGIPVTGGGQVITIGSCATARIVTPPDPPAGVTYTAVVVSADDLPKALPGKLISCAVKIVATPASATLGANVQVCFPVPPTQAGFAYDWLGPWQKTDTLPTNGQSCVIVPASAVNASYTGLFNSP
jgi:hypothetical protein